MACAYIYGDSLLKATVPDEQFRYHFHLQEVMDRYAGRRTEVVNRSKMGATIRKGLSLVRHDLDRGLEARYALVSYGGNDSDFDWAGPRRNTSPAQLCRSFAAPCWTCCKSSGARVCSRYS